MVRPRELVVPVPDKVWFQQKSTRTKPIKQRATHMFINEGEHSKHPEKAESDPGIGNYDQHNWS